MAGHSEWQNRKYRKRRQDRKRAKIFGKLSKKIISAARQGGGDPEKNSDLRNVIERAKDYNMPKENIERAILKGIGELPGVDYEDHRYEGYGPGGVAVMVECTTDNKNRTISELRRIFDNHGGKIGERGCVSYQFERSGFIRGRLDELGRSELFERAVEAGAEDVRFDDARFEILTRPDDFVSVKQTLEEFGLALERSEVIQLPKSTVPVDEEDFEDVISLLETLDDHDDVQEVYSNFNVEDAVLEDRPTAGVNS